MWAFYIFLAVLLVLFFVWAAHKTRGRDSGLEARGERHRQTGGYGEGA